MDGLQFSDIFKALIGPVAGVAMAWLVGNRLAADWALRQKRREQSLATIGEFYRLYGAFFALWKICNHAFREHKHELEKSKLWELMERSAALEASSEAILLRIASEIILTDDQIQTLGVFRQGVQLLRDSIRRQESLGWVSSEHLAYVAFKNAAVGVGRLAAKVGPNEAPKLEKAQAQLRAITANKWKEVWEDSTRSGVSGQP